MKELPFTKQKNTHNAGVVVWLTGLSGSGKSTICHAVHEVLIARGMSVEILDGDDLRKELTRDLGFSKEDRDENIRRIGYVAHVLSRHGVVVLVAAISPYRASRDRVRKTVGNFLEVYVDAPLDVCESRDPKGLYAKARAGEILSFTGIDDPYEEPLKPEVHCDTFMEPLEESREKVLEAIRDKLGQMS
jgi:adenylylsulfate kinase